MIFALKDETQVALFRVMQGQISDGYWENASPQNHWKPWIAAEVIVDPANIGRDFSVQKDNYALNTKPLVDLIEDQLIEAAESVVGKNYYNRKWLDRDLREIKLAMRQMRK